VADARDVEQRLALDIRIALRGKAPLEKLCAKAALEQGFHPE
jgi:hypothetical protein